MHELSQFRQRHPSCVIVVFADLSTGMVLAADTQKKMTQERLDELCQRAIQALMGTTAEQISASMQTENSVRSALLSRGAFVEVFLAARLPAQEVLCLVVKSECGDVEILNHAQTLLHDLSEDA